MLGPKFNIRLQYENYIKDFCYETRSENAIVTCRNYHPAMHIPAAKFNKC